MPAVARPTTQSKRGSQAGPTLALNALHKISSFEKNPASGGMPAIASAEIKNVSHVVFMCFDSWPILNMSCSPESPWMTEPAPRNKHALKKAWVSR